MGLRINTNVPAMTSQRALGRTRTALNDNLRKLSSGERITKASDDAAGLAISENLKAQIRGYHQCKRNAGDAISLIQTAEGGLSAISTMIIRLRELAIQAATDTLSDRERLFTDVEYQKLKDEINRISYSSEFNGIKLLDGTGGHKDFQIGIYNNPVNDRLQYDATTINSTVEALGLTGLNIKTKLGAQSSLSILDDSLVQINGYRAQLGATQNRLSSAIGNLEITEENISSANSRIRDVDIAKETASLTKHKILLDAGVSVLSQASNFPKVALKLINSG